MNIGFVNLLRCPQCMSEMNLLPYKSIGKEEVIDGLLKCTCGAAYLVHKGVACMVPPTYLPPAYAESYRNQLGFDAPALLQLATRPGPAEFSFSWQWNEHLYNDLTWELNLEERIKIFYRYISMTPAQVKGLHLLDAGCGNGTLSARLALEGINVVAMDFSDGVVRAYQYQHFESRIKEEAATRLNYLQGDLQHPPFPDNQFDLIYSDGVLHHTPDTRRTFLAVATKVKLGGRFFVWLYRSDTKGTETIKNILVKLVRVATAWMSYSNRLRLCYFSAFSILLGVRVLHIFGWRGRPVIPLRQKAINLFDTITPSYNHEHTPGEVEGWFREAGYMDVKEVTIHEYRLGKGGFAMIGTRGSKM